MVNFQLLTMSVLYPIDKMKLAVVGSSSVKKSIFVRLRNWIAAFTEIVLITQNVTKLSRLNRFIHVTGIQRNTQK